jgi:hypothetical protein
VCPTNSSAAACANLPASFPYLDPSEVNSALTSGTTNAAALVSFVIWFANAIKQLYLNLLNKFCQCKSSCDGVSPNLCCELLQFQCQLSASYALFVDLRALSVTGYLDQLLALISGGDTSLFAATVQIAFQALCQDYTRFLAIVECACNRKEQNPCHESECSSDSSDTCSTASSSTGNCDRSSSQRSKVRVVRALRK